MAIYRAQQTDRDVSWRLRRCKNRRIMDELLLASHLRRADDPGQGGVDNKQPILKEKPKTPYIILPNEPRFKHLLNKSKFACDIGGTLVKLVYTTVCECENGSVTHEVLLNFKKFMSIEECLDFVSENWKDRTPEDIIYCTGGGSYKHGEAIKQKLNVRAVRTDEMDALIFGCDFLLQNNEDESFTYHHEATGIERYRYKPINEDAIHPFLLVNIGTGISILKVDSPTSFKRVGGSSMGGGSFIGLGKLLTKAKTFDELLLLAEKGDHRKSDTLVSDIYGGGYDNLNLAADLIAGSFGKCNRTEGVSEQNPEDLAKSLLLMISNNIGQMAMLYGQHYKMNRIYFGGFFIRKHPITMRTLTYAIDFWSQGKAEALFLKHEGYLGAMGAFLDDSGSDIE
ncbi:unnamed protein product [Auanema sp. JU1783]|nr:unnamed protein product [Auanema sp. JU1783]